VLRARRACSTRRATTAASRRRGRRAGAITDFVSCQRAAKGVSSTQLDKDAVEALDWSRWTCLGNRALTTIDDCLQQLAARGIALDLESLPRTTSARRPRCQQGRTVGCFQVESPGMRNLLQQIGARTMDDVIQAVALIRPGPAGSGMKDAYVRRFRGLEPPTPPHARLTDVLWDTHGIMLYQEDVMQAASLVAAWSLAEADRLRRALQKHRTPSSARCASASSRRAEQGIARAEAPRVWDLIANFASFGFCKAHAVTYGRIAYRAVWLKTHHPGRYLARFLPARPATTTPRVYVEEARRLGVPILPPT
jgi:DNA polymerase III alpha subunit